MSDAFNWGASKEKSTNQGKDYQLPKHIARMNNPTEVVEVKKDVNGGGLPWGGQPSEKSKAFASGPPKDKGSMMNGTGERKSPVGTLKGGVHMKPGHLPHESHPAHAGHAMQIKSVHHKMHK